MTGAPQEIERKFLLKSLPGDLDTHNSRHLSQGYLCMEEDREVRIRAEQSQWEMTFKKGGGMVRTEVNVAITREQFEQLWPATDGRRVEKTRYHYPLGDHLVEIDVYEGELNPLIVAEVEFNSEGEAEQFVLPDFFDREITGDKAFKNSRLAMLGLPE